MIESAPHAARGTTWVAVFDGGRAVVFLNDGTDRHPSLRFVSKLEHEVPPTRELGTDRPGRFETPQGGRTAVETSDLHTAEETRFVGRIAELVEAGAKAGRFDRLIVVAPGRLLPKLRDLAPISARRIVAERQGDFAHMPVEQIERAVAEATV